jgi:hypothetical protein
MDSRLRGNDGTGLRHSGRRPGIHEFNAFAMLFVPIAVVLSQIAV